MSLLDRERKLDLYGPNGIIQFVEAFTGVLGGLGFPLIVHEIEGEGVIYEGKEYSIHTVHADHDLTAFSYIFEEGPIPGRFHPEKAKKLGVPEGPLWKRLQEGEDVQLPNGKVVDWNLIVDEPRNGLKVAYSGDTRPTMVFAEAARGADLLIHEATFDEELSERAKENGHSTAVQAAGVALEADVGKLVLTHISSRYPEGALLLEEARGVFSETVLAFDLMELKLTRN